VQGMAEVSPGVIWAGKPNDGLYQWDGRYFNRLAGSDFPRRYPEMGALLCARDATCWAAGAHGLLHFTNPVAVAPAAEMPILAGRSFSALAEDRRGSIWAGTRDGELWHLRSGRWDRQTNFVPAHPLTAIVPERDGSLWLGTEGGGVYRFRDKVVSQIGKRDGLLSEAVRTLYLDPQGALWIGTVGGGLSLWRDNRAATFTTREGLPDNTVSVILEDDSARLWLGGNRGIARVEKRDLQALAASLIPAVYPQIYGRAEGMLSEECAGGFFPAGLKTSSGQLWFSTLKGIVAIDPRPQHPRALPPPVVLEDMLVDGVAIDLPRETDANPRGARVGPVDASRHPDLPKPGSAVVERLRPPYARITLPPGRHRLEFHYAGLSFTAPERVRFRYRLDHADSEWVEAGTRRTAYYDYVPPGDYVFRATACNSEGVWNDEGASLSLTMQPHFYQAWWFRGLAALGLLGSVGAVVRFLEKRKLHLRLQRLEQERALARERSRIAQDLHDDLGSSLTRISLLTDLVKADKNTPAQIEIHAAKIFQAASQTVRSLEEIVWALRPGSDSLQSLVEYIAHFAGELFEGDSARCRLDLPHDLPAWSLPPEIRHNLFLVVKEALTNALKHASAREVLVQARALGDTLELVVQDDGKGFNPEASPRSGKHQGLGNMRRRAEAMGGALEIRSASGQGACLRLSVKFPAPLPIEDPH